MWDPGGRCGGEKNGGEGMIVKKSGSVSNLVSFVVSMDFCLNVVAM
jgi:hypothetical protein